MEAEHPRSQKDRPHVRVLTATYTHAQAEVFLFCQESHATNTIFVDVVFLDGDEKTWAERMRYVSRHS